MANDLDRPDVTAYSADPREALDPMDAYARLALQKLGLGGIADAGDALQEMLRGRLGSILSTPQEYGNTTEVAKTTPGTPSPTSGGGLIADPAGASERPSSRFGDDFVQVVSGAYKDNGGKEMTPEVMDAFLSSPEGKYANTLYDEDGAINDVNEKYIQEAFDTWVKKGAKAGRKEAPPAAPPTPDRKPTAEDATVAKAVERHVAERTPFAGLGGFYGGGRR